MLLTHTMGCCLQLAAKVIGDQELAQKFEDSVQTIRRDIMFAASLYI
jgi:superfamily II RNA helicase